MVGFELGVEGLVGNLVFVFIEFLFLVGVGRYEKINKDRNYFILGCSNWFGESKIGWCDIVIEAGGIDLSLGYLRRFCLSWDLNDEKKLVKWGFWGSCSRR